MLHKTKYFFCVKCIFNYYYFQTTKPGLDIPTINWDEIHDKKNKKYKIESNIRKTQHKEIQV